MHGKILFSLFFCGYTLYKYLSSYKIIITLVPITICIYVCIKKLKNISCQNKNLSCDYYHQHLLECLLV